MRHRPVLVVAPGRSGTSTVARLLHTVFGVKMGDHFHPPDQHNKQGYFEDLDFRKLDESFANPKPPHQLLSAPFWELLTKQSIEAKLGEEVPWGYKEPRLSFFLGYHVDILRKLGVEPVLLRPRRPIYKVAASVHMRREGWDKIWEAFGGVALREYVLDETIKCLGLTCHEFWLPSDGSQVPDERFVVWIKACLQAEGLEYDRDRVEGFLRGEKEARLEEAPVE